MSLQSCLKMLFFVSSYKIQLDIFSGGSMGVEKGNQGFARHGTHLYAHNYVPVLGFLFVLRGIEEKKNA